jgi:hypothetical protein
MRNKDYFACKNSSCLDTTVQLVILYFLSEYHCFIVIISLHEAVSVQEDSICYCLLYYYFKFNELLGLHQTKNVD